MKRTWIEGHRVLITGAAGGLGQAMAEEFRRHGASLVLTDVDVAGLDAAAATLRKAGAEVSTFEHDVTDLAAWTEIAEQLQDEGPFPRILVNNAGVAVLGRGLELSLDAWKAVIDIDLWGVIHGCREFVPRMQQLRSSEPPGHPPCAVLNVASAAAYIGGPMAAPYFVAKAGVFRLGQSLRVEIDPRQVSFTTVCPGQVETGIGEASARLGGRSDVGGVVDWLAGPGRVPADVAKRAVAGVLRRRAVVNVYREAWGLNLLTRVLPYGWQTALSRIYFRHRFPELAR